MSTYKKIVIVAGEESGDRLASEFVKKLRALTPNITISGIGGTHMQQAGVELISDLAQFGVTGLIEVLRHARVIRQAFKRMKSHLSEKKPDLLILVDYPGFNLRLAKFAKSALNIKILYYISPQIWAWKANRIDNIKKYIDHMAVILPFEKKIYEEAHIPVAFVGHPLLTAPAINASHFSFEKKTNRTLIALLPGSRRHELAQHLPIMRKAAELLTKKIPQVDFIIPIAKTIPQELVTSYFKDSPISMTFIEQQANQVVSISDFVIVASGTASLECALQLKPMCIIYKASFITYLIANKLIKIKYLGLCNILKNKMIVPELLQYDCNPTELANLVYTLLTHAKPRNNMQRSLKEIKALLSPEAADCEVEELILNLLELSGE